MLKKLMITTAITGLDDRRRRRRRHVAEFTGRDPGRRQPRRRPLPQVDDRCGTGSCREVHAR